MIDDVVVVIPCFNDGQFVESAVRSVVDQGAGRVIVVDDGSTDDLTLQVLERLRQHVTVVSQGNQGPAAARMAGVHLSSEPLILALDADDALYPGALARLRQAMIDDPSLDVVWGDVLTSQPRSRRIAKARTLDRWRITFVNELVASTLVRRDALVRAGGWRSGVPFEDWDLWMRMAAQGARGRHIGGVSLVYRESSTGRYRSELADYPARVKRLRELNSTLMEQRSHNRASADAGPALKACWTLIATIPMPPRIERYVTYGALLVCEPLRRRRSA